MKHPAGAGNKSAWLANAAAAMSSESSPASRNSMLVYCAPMSTREISASIRPSTGWPRILAAFALMFILYQLAEGLQVRYAPGHPAGPVLMLCALFIAWPLGRWLGWRGFDAYGLDGLRNRMTLLAALLGAGILAKLLSLTVGLEAGLYAQASGVRALSPLLVLMAGLTTFVPSIAEDILTRGFLLRTVPVRFAAWSFVLLSAALYTANHIWRFDWGWTEQLRLFCLGLAYAAAAWRWRTLWAAVALHWGWNFGSALADGIMPVTVADVEGVRLLSAGVHLSVLAIVLLLPRRAAGA